jgi:hypothetical protein
MACTSVTEVAGGKAIAVQLEALRLLAAALAGCPEGVSIDSVTFCLSRHQ